MKIRKIILIAMLCSVGITMEAGTHLISPADYGTSGTKFIYKTAWWMTVGENCWKNFAEFTTFGNAVEGDTVFVEAGTYADDVTIDIKGLTFLGNNAYCQIRSGNRTNEESIITGKFTIAADNITINGFQFTGNGCVVNETATTESPLSGFKFIYNDVTGSTLERLTNVAVVRLGKQTGPAAGGLEATAHRKYNGVTISHNSFAGSSTNPAHFVIVGGSYGETNVVDNTFNDGGTSITMANSQGVINVLDNTFTNVGDVNRIWVTDGVEEKGEIALFLYYIAHSNTTTVNIKNNMFDNCLGRSSMYAPVRFYNGDTEKAQLPPVGCRINLNYNIFKNKTKVSGNNYNYVFYTNYNEEADIDTRFNQFDNGDMAIGLVKQPWESEDKRNMASSYELIDFAGTTGKYSELSYYKDPTDAEVKDLNLKKSVRVAQSFDIDEKTGDIFFIQIYPETSVNSTALKSQEPLVVTRYYKKSDGTMGQQYMYLDNAGHGSNMAVCWHNGTRYIVTGGDGEDVGESTQSNCISFIPFVSGALVDCSKSSFTNKDGTTTYDIKKFYNPLGDGNPYPSVDQTSRLFLERNVNGANVRMCIYNLDEVIEQGGAATPLRVVNIKKVMRDDNDNVVSYGDDPNPANVSPRSDDPQDCGFQTWDPQGLTISGDYLYFAEGVGEGNKLAVKNDNGNAVPTVIIHTYNWKTDKFAYRKRSKTSKILGLVHGEPEGIKVHRDDKGRPCLLLGIATGASGARKANIFSFLPAPNTTSEENGMTAGLTFDIPVAVSTPEVSNVYFEAYYTGDYYEYFSVTNSIQDGGENATLNGEMSLTISGEDADCFSVSAEKSGAFDKTTDITVHYSPSTIKDFHTATLRISSPNAEDVLIPLSGAYKGTLTSVDEIEMPENVVMKRVGDIISFSEEVVEVELYDLAGMKRAEGYRSVNLGNMPKGIYIVKCFTENGIFVKKITI